MKPQFWGLQSLSAGDALGQARQRAWVKTLVPGTHSHSWYSQMFILLGMVIIL